VKRSANEVYRRLERADPRRWEELRGCTVKHCVFGEGTISHVMMPDWSNPVHLFVRFGQRERMFHLSSFGDGTKFRANALPAQLAGAIASAEQEITQEAQRLEEDLQRRECAAREAVLCREEQEATRVARHRLTMTLVRVR
jgi:hypothetical protein